MTKYAVYKFPIGTKVWIKKKTIWDRLPRIIGRSHGAPKPHKDLSGKYFGWVRDHRLETFIPNDGSAGQLREWINVVVYTKGKTIGGDY